MKNIISGASILIIITSLSLFSSCKQNDTQPKVNVDPAILKYLCQPGSYWVYQKENSNIIDSEYVVSVHNGYSQYPHPVGDNRQYLYTTMVMGHYAPGQANPLYSDALTLQDTYIQWGENTVPNYNVTLIYFIKSGINDTSRSTGNGNAMIVLSHPDTLTIGKYSFKAVDKIALSYQNTDIIHYYWSPDIGIVRIEKRVDANLPPVWENWNIVRWRVIH